MHFRTLRRFSFILLILTSGLTGGGLFLIDPTGFHLLGMGAVFGLWFLWVCSACLFSLLTLSERWLGMERTQMYQGAALRQSGLLALLLTLVAFIQYQRVLTWWGVLLGGVLILLIELSVRRWYAPTL